MIIKNQSKTGASDYELINGKYYAVLHRKTETSETESCMFCGKRHSHGIGEGRRSAHCISKDGSPVDAEIILGTGPNGEEIKVHSRDGYLVRTGKKQ